MKRTILKVHRNFKLQPRINSTLRREAKRTNRTETAIVEMALAEWFAIKRN